MSTPGTANSLPSHDPESSRLRLAICDAVRAECQSFLAADLLALIVTGSLAREETTIVQDEAGLRFLSDAEFVVVVRSRAAQSLHNQLSARIEVALTRLGLRIHVSLALVRTDYLRNLPPHIFTYELRNCGRVIAGDAAALELIPDFPSFEISREDAWRLLANRMTEFLEGAAELTGASSSPQGQYRAMKLVLDMATSLLVFLGEYEPTYQQRSTRLVALAAREPSRFPFPAMEFASRVAQCTAYKLSPAGMTLPSDLPSQAITCARLLWTWELRHLTSSEGGDEELFLRLCRRLSASAVLRGWAYALRAEVRHGSWRFWPRWLSLLPCGTPRYCIYRATYRLFCQLPAASAPDPEFILRVEKMLPVSHSRTNGTSWEDLAGDIVWNYRRFVVETRA